MFNRLYILIIASILFVNSSYSQGVMEKLAFPGTNNSSNPWVPSTQGIDLSALNGNNTNAGMHAHKLLPESSPNYSRFSTVKKQLNNEAVASNKGFENHPEYGLLLPGAPCDDCYELIGERTETSKTFVKNELHNGHQQKLTQTSTQPMHYKDANGNWLTIRTQLQPAGKGTYAVPHEATPVEISCNNGSAFNKLGNVNNFLKFNNNLELVFQQADGKELSLGKADFTHHTAGDAGVYVTNAWDGIDIEMTIMRGAIKTNFHLNKALPQYAGGKLMIRDHLEFANGLKMETGGKISFKGEFTINDIYGNPAYGVGEANIYEKNNYQNSLKELEYHIGINNSLDIVIPGENMNKSTDTYPLIIDPLVTAATSSTVNGSTYITVLTATSGCEYFNAANTPPNCTVTDVQFAFQYTTVSPMGLEYGGSVFYLGTCRSPGTLAGGLIWSCASALPGTCTSTGGTTYSIFSDISPCLPAPSCPSIALNIDMYLMQSWATTAPCAITWCYGSQPLVITVVGETIAASPVTVTGGGTTICEGSSTVLHGAGTYGVPPYSFTWYPGGFTGTPVTVSPTVTTIYTLTVTDACGQTATATKTITVDPVAPITGDSVLCSGTTSVLTNTVTGGTWSTSSGTVATVTAAGLVTAVGPGTCTITYTAPGGCTSTITITVNSAPDPIAGITNVCVGSTTNLSDAITGGTWSSGTPSIATIGGTGIVTGVAAGTSEIYYAMPGGCSDSVTVTVNPVPGAISGITTLCSGLTTLLTDPVSGGSWTSSNTAVATVSTGGLVTAIASGTSTITYTLPGGCFVTITVTVISSTDPVTGDSSVCVGSTTLLGDAATGGSWSSGNTAIATIGSGTGIVTGVAPGTATIIYSLGGGCEDSTVVTVNTVPGAINGPAQLCATDTATYTNSTAGGTWSSGSTAIATIGASGLLTAVSGGNVTITYTLPGGCYATFIVNVIPMPAAITGESSVCTGNVIALSESVTSGTWSTSNTSVATVNSATGVVTGITAGTDTVYYTIGTSCQVFFDVNVVLTPMPPIVTDTSYCINTTNVPALQATGENILWYSSPSLGSPIPDPVPNTTALGTFFWYATQTVGGCTSNEATSTVIIFSTPQYNVNVSRAFVCEYDTITLQYAPLFAGSYQFTWTLPAGDTLLSTCSLTDSTITLYCDTIYGNNVILNVSSGGSCTSIDTIPINVIALPHAHAWMSPDVCQGDTMLLALSSISEDAYTYSWNFNGANIITANNNSGGPFTITWSDTGIHVVQVQATSPQGCVGPTGFDTTDVHSLPDASFKVISAPSTLCLMDSVWFQANTLNQAYAYTWLPQEDFNYDNGANNWGIMKYIGNVYLKVTDPWGCSSTDSLNMAPQSCCMVYFPTAFVPAATGSNTIDNKFLPLFQNGSFHKYHDFRITNRWGQVVFETTSTDAGWDGTMNGVPQDVGVYFWYIEYDCGGATQTAHGDVTLVR